MSLAGVVGIEEKERKKRESVEEKKKHNPPGRIKGRFNSGETMIPWADWGFLTFDTGGGKIKGLTRRVKKRYPNACGGKKKRKKERKKE